MQNSSYMVFGNLAVAAQRQPSWEVLDGGALESPQPSAPSHGQEAASRLDADALKRNAMTVLASAILLALLIAVVFGCARSRSAAYHAIVDSLETVEVSVQTGDSLWSIASSHPVEGLDTAQTVELIEQINGLDSATLQPGMTLSVPCSS